MVHFLLQSATKNLYERRATPPTPPSEVLDHNQASLLAVTEYFFDLQLNIRLFLLFLRVSFGIPPSSRRSNLYEFGPLTLSLGAPQHWQTYIPCPHFTPSFRIHIRRCALHGNESMIIPFGGVICDPTRCFVKLREKMNVFKDRNLNPKDTSERRHLLLFAKYGMEPSKRTFCWRWRGAESNSLMNSGKQWLLQVRTL